MTDSITKPEPSDITDDLAARLECIRAILLLYMAKKACTPDYPVLCALDELIEHFRDDLQHLAETLAAMEVQA